MLRTDPGVRCNYGGTTATEMSFGVHALIMRHYFKGLPQGPVVQ
jgi:hypothetical protein